METDWPITTGPYPAESSTTTSPPLAVFASAAPRERHGDGSEHGSASFPSPDTNVRCAETASDGVASSKIDRKSAAHRARHVGIGHLLAGSRGHRTHNHIGDVVEIGFPATLSTIALFP